MKEERERCVLKIKKMPSFGDTLFNLPGSVCRFKDSFFLFPLKKTNLLMTACVCELGVGKKSLELCQPVCVCSKEAMKRPPKKEKARDQVNFWGEKEDEESKKKWEEG